MDVKWIEVSKEEPKQGGVVVVTGRSGYMKNKEFLTFAYIDDEYRPRFAGSGPRWLGVDNAQLSDHGWYPTHWTRDIKLPEVK